MAARERYRSGARLYDLLSLERPVYGGARIAALELLAARPGQRVLDLGCGTGLNHPRLHAAVGAGGRVLGVDRSAEMLEVARRRALRRGLSSVRLLQSDATALDAERAIAELGGAADLVVATYTLSIMSDPAVAWVRALDAAAPDARLAIVDMQRPRGLLWPVGPLLAAFARFGGSDLEARPWTLIEDAADDVVARSFWGGHIQVRAGVRRGDPGLRIPPHGRLSS
jgi:demethylmenaquinone methyltransferase/2-methoxy-6-polyprenyl-1,4-benzoquinol methylase